jgi:type I restriction enzyme M protein
MSDSSQQQLGNTLWAIADQLRGAMNADDFRDYMLAFLFLRYLSDNYEIAARKELGSDTRSSRPTAISFRSTSGMSSILRMWMPLKSRCAARSIM